MRDFQLMSDTECRRVVGGMPTVAAIAYAVYRGLKYVADAVSGAL